MLITRYFSLGDTTPSLQHYLRDRKPFLQLRTPDVQTPRRARINLKFGQETVTQCKKKINSLQQEIRRLRKKLVTMRDTIDHLENEGRISATTAETLSVG